MKKSRMVIKVDRYGTLMINRSNHILIVFHLHGRVWKTKWRNGEMTFLKSENKWLPLFCRVQLLCLCLPWTGKTCSACWCKTSQTLLCHRSYRSHLFFLVLRISPLPRDFSVLSVSARRLVLKPFIGNCNRANFTLQLLLLFANKFH